MSTQFEQLFGKAPSEGERAIGLLITEVVEGSGASGADLAGGLLLALTDNLFRCVGRQRAAEMLRDMAAAIEQGETQG